MTQYLIDIETVSVADTSWQPPRLYYRRKRVWWQPWTWREVNRWIELPSDRFTFKFGADYE